MAEIERRTWKPRKWQDRSDTIEGLRQAVWALQIREAVLLEVIRLMAVDDDQMRCSSCAAAPPVLEEGTTKPLHEEGR